MTYGTRDLCVSQNQLDKKHSAFLVSYVLASETYIKLYITDASSQFGQNIHINNITTIFVIAENLWY